MGDDEVEFLGAEGERFAGEGDGEAAGEGGHFRRKIGGNDGHAARPQGFGDGAATAEIQGGLECGFRVVQAVEEVGGEGFEHRGDGVEGGGGAAAMQADGFLVEDLLGHVKNLLAAMKPVGLAVLDSLLPPACLACDAPVGADGQFCLPCFRRANFVSAPLCASCGVPLPFGAYAGVEEICGVCEASPPAFSQARAALRYDEMAKGLILPFKYADRTDLSRGLARLMARAGAKLLERAEVVVPVPLHVRRLRQRRYNQAALLAGELGRMARKPVLQDALARVRETVPLGPLAAAARREVLVGTISVRRDVAGL